MKILISGAGPAGLTIAYWLKHYGFTPTVIERAPSLPIGGYKIDVRGEALKVLQRMNIYDAVVKAGTDMQRALLVDGNGKVINQMSGDAFGHRTGGDVEILRGKLCQILMNQNSQIEFIFGDVIQSVSEFEKGIHVEFQKSKARDFDLVIGADGIHSSVRRLVFGDESNYLRELGLYLCVYSIPNYLDLDRIEMQYSELGKVANIWSVRGDANAKACFGFVAPSNSVDFNHRVQQEMLLKNAYKGIGWEIPKLLQMMPEATDFYFDAAAQISMDRWSKGRVILLGDAAYCPSPMSGQGTSLALIGAYVLAGELAAASGDYLAAWERYEEALRPFVKINQALGTEAAKVMRVQEKKNLTGWLTQKMMRVMPGKFIEFFLYLATRRIRLASNSILLKEYIVPAKPIEKGDTCRS